MAAGIGGGAMATSDIMNIAVNIFHSGYIHQDQSSPQLLSYPSQQQCMHFPDPLATPPP